MADKARAEAERSRVISSTILRPHPAGPNRELAASVAPMIASFRLSSNFFLVASTSSLIKPGEEDFSPDRIRMKTSRPEWSPIFQRDFAAAKLTSGDGSLRAFFSRGMERRARICPRLMAASWRVEEFLSARAVWTWWRRRARGDTV